MLLSVRRIVQLRPIVASLSNTNRLIVATQSNFDVKTHTPFVVDTQLQFVRQYAKSKDKKTEKARNKGFRTFQMSVDDLNEVVNIAAYNEQLQKTLDKMQDDFIQNLSLRSTTGALDALKVKVDGKVHELHELAQISRKNPKTIILNMIAFPQTIPAVLQALQTSGMNLNPQQEGTTLFVPVPKITKEFRENLAKNAKAVFIKYRDAIKAIQNESIRKVKKNTEISDDVSRSVQGQLVSIADEFVAKAEKMLAAKQKELLGGS